MFTCHPGHTSDQESGDAVCVEAKPAKAAGAQGRGAENWGSVAYANPLSLQGRDPQNIS